MLEKKNKFLISMIDLEGEINKHVNSVDYIMDELIKEHPSHNHSIINVFGLLKVRIADLPKSEKFSNEIELRKRIRELLVSKILNTSSVTKLIKEVQAEAILKINVFFPES